MGEADRIQIQVSDDELEAFATVGPGDPMDRAALEHRLTALEIREGLDPTGLDRVAEALAREIGRPEAVCIARGEAPVAGRPAMLELEEPGGPVPGTLREDGSLDFRERRLLVPVAEGALLGRIHPAQEGKAGRSIFGAALEPPPPPEADLRFGEGVRVEGERVIAARDGARTIDATSGLDVVDLHVHEGAVDATSGHLETRGSLEVTRDVAVGLRVRASHDVAIGGVLDGGIVEAGGSVEIARGAIGREEGSVQAGGDLRVGHALGIRLRAMGVLRVTKSVSTSHLHAREVEVGGKALSDEIAAESRIHVQSAGSPAGGPCRLRAAVPLEPADFDPSLRPAPIGGPSPARKRRGGHRDTPSRTRQNKRRRLARSEDLEKRLAWRRNQRALERSACVVVDGEAHAGCCIEIATARLVLDETVRRQTFRLDPETGEIAASETPT